MAASHPEQAHAAAVPIDADRFGLLAIRSLYVAAKLDIATVLGDVELDVDAIATRVAAKADATGRLLRLLAAIGVFEERAPHVFCNNKVSAFLRTDNPKNVRAMILMHNSDAMSRPWYEHLEQGIREEVPPFRLTHGEDLFDYLDHHADLDALFSEAMDSVEALTGIASLLISTGGAMNES